jgi:hypothetical protein
MVFSRRDAGRLEREDMPKSAAIFFGVVLVAASIGFNIWRYPTVWQMTGTMMPSAVKMAEAPAAPRPTPAAVEPLQASGSASTISPIKLPPSKPEYAATPPLLMKGPDVPKPIADVKGKQTAAVKIESPPPAPDRLEKPMAPVPKMAGITSAVPPIGGLQGSDAVRRLPPVDPSEPTLVGTYPSRFSGSIPIYPSTGIQ